MHAELHPAARAELVEITRYIEDRRIGYGERFLGAFVQARDFLLKYRHGGPRTHGGRRKRIIGFKYDIIYRVYHDLVFIIAIAHHKRRPFWGRRRRK